MFSPIRGFRSPTRRKSAKSRSHLRFRMHLVAWCIALIGTMATSESCSAQGFPRLDIELHRLSERFDLTDADSDSLLNELRADAEFQSEAEMVQNRHINYYVRKWSLRLHEFAIELVEDKDSIREAIESIREFHQWFQQEAQSQFLLLLEQNILLTDSQVEQIKELIAREWTHELELEALSIGPGGLFKQHPFFDVLSNSRMKKILTKSQFAVYEDLHVFAGAWSEKVSLARKGDWNAIVGRQNERIVEAELDFLKTLLGLEVDQLTEIQTVLGTRMEGVSADWEKFAKVARVDPNAVFQSRTSRKLISICRREQLYFETSQETVFHEILDEEQLVRWQQYLANRRTRFARSLSFQYVDMLLLEATIAGKEAKDLQQLMVDQMTSNISGSEVVFVNSAFSIGEDELKRILSDRSYEVIRIRFELNRKKAQEVFSKISPAKK